MTSMSLYLILAPSQTLISHNGGKSPLMYPTVEENLFCCIPQRRKISSIVSHSKMLLLCISQWQKTTNFNSYVSINLSCEIIYTHESRRSSLMTKN